MNQHLKASTDWAAILKRASAPWNKARIRHTDPDILPSTSWGQSPWFSRDVAAAIEFTFYAAFAGYSCEQLQGLTKTFAQSLNGRSPTWAAVYGDSALEFIDGPLSELTVAEFLGPLQKVKRVQLFYIAPIFKALDAATAGSKVKSQTEIKSARDAFIKKQKAPA